MAFNKNTARADAEEQGTKNEEISDSDKKMDALMDMIRDACAKLDEGSKRLDARMDAVEENLRRSDSVKKDEDEEERKADKKADADEDEEAEKKADRKDARKDEDGEPEKKGESKDVAADKRSDASKKDEDEREEAAAEKKADRKDARKDARRKDEDEDAMADRDFITREEAAKLRADIAALQVRAPTLISDSDRERIATIQEEADPHFQAFGDQAPAPLDGETPIQYKRRLAAKLQGHSKKWKDVRLSSFSDEAALDAVVSDIYADASAAARAGADVPMGQLRPRKYEQGGHTFIEYDGDASTWMNPLAGHTQRATGNWNRPN